MCIFVIILENATFLPLVLLTKVIKQYKWNAAAIKIRHKHTHNSIGCSIYIVKILTATN